MLSEIIRASGDRDRVWAQRLGISKSYLSMLMAGKKKPSLVVATRIEHLTDGRVLATSWVDDCPQPEDRAA